MPGVSPNGTSRELRPLWRTSLGDYPTSLAFFPAGDRIGVGTGNGDVVVLDARTGKEIWRKPAHGGGVLDLAVGPRFVASGGQDGRARVFSPEGDLVRDLEGGAAWVLRVAWSPQGTLATAAGKVVRIWNADGTPRLETQAHPSTVTALQWNRRGTELATSCYGGAYVWPLRAGANPRHLPFKGSLISLAWSPDEKVLACGSQDCSVHFWRLETGRDSEMSGYPLKPKALAWDAGSSMLATGGDATITVWDFAGKGPEGTRPRQLASHKGQVVALGFHPRKGLLASAASDMGVVFWEPRRAPSPVAFGFLEDTPETLAWHPEEPRLATIDAGGDVSSFALA